MSQFTNLNVWKKSYFGWSFVKLKGNEIEVKLLTGLKNKQRGQWKRNKKFEIWNLKLDAGNISSHSPFKFSLCLKFNGKQLC